AALAEADGLERAVARDVDRRQRIAVVEQALVAPERTPAAHHFVQAREVVHADPGRQAQLAQRTLPAAAAQGGEVEGNRVGHGAILALRTRHPAPGRGTRFSGHGCAAGRNAVRAPEPRRGGRFAAIRGSARLLAVVSGVRRPPCAAHAAWPGPAPSSRTNRARARPPSRLPRRTAGAAASARFRPKRWKTWSGRPAAR